MFSIALAIDRGTCSPVDTHPTATAADKGINEFAAGLEDGEDRFLILAHKLTAPNHVGSEDGGKSALNAALAHALHRYTHQHILRDMPNGMVASVGARELKSPLGLPSNFVRKGLLWLHSGDVREPAAASYPHIHCGGGDFPCLAGGVCGERRLA